MQWKIKNMNWQKMGAKEEEEERQERRGKEAPWHIEEGKRK